MAECSAGYVTGVFIILSNLRVLHSLLNAGRLRAAAWFFFLTLFLFVFAVPNLRVFQKQEAVPWVHE